MDERASDQRRAAWGLALACAAALVLLTVLVAARWSPLITADDEILAGVHAWAREAPVAVGTSRVLAFLGAWQFSTLVAVVTVVILGALRRWRWAVGVAVVAALAPLVTDLLKPLVERPRPVWPDPFASEPSWSFPSGHATGGVAVWCVCAVALGLAARDRWGWSQRRTAAVVGPFVALGVLIGISRVVLGVHNPSDVVGGWLVALTVAASVLAVLVPTRAAVPGPPANADPPAGTRDGTPQR